MSLRALRAVPHRRVLQNVATSRTNATIINATAGLSIRHHSYSTKPNQSRNTFGMLRLGNFFKLTDLEGTKDPNALRRKLQDVIHGGDKNSRNREQVLECLRIAKKQHVELDWKEYYVGLTVCSEMNRVDEIAYWLFDALQAEGAVTISGYVKMLRVCSLGKDCYKALEVADIYKVSNFAPAQSFLSELLLVLAGNARSVEVFQRLDETYQEFRRLGFKDTRAQLYIDVACSYTRFKVPEQALAVLRDMTEANHVPSPMLCRELLSNALFHADAALLRVLAGWYINNFNTPLEVGVLNRMLAVAAMRGDGRLAQLAFHVSHNYLDLNM